MQVVLKVLERTDEAVTGTFYALELVDLAFGEQCRLAAVGMRHLNDREVGKAFTDALDIELGAVSEAGWHAKGQDYAGNGGMYAASMHAVPKGASNGYIETLDMYSTPVSEDEQPNKEQCPLEIGEVQMVGVLDGNHKDAAQVICYGQCGQKNLQTNGYTLAEHAQYTQGEGNVRGHGDGHTALHDGLGRTGKIEYQHGDYHIGNMMIDQDGVLTIIDFDRDDFGDPWEEFNRIVWCAQAAPAFASGMVDGYFDGEVPMAFWKLLALYICSNTLSSLPWAIPFGEKEIETMKNQAKEVLDWYENMKNPVPRWYGKE